MENNSKSSAEAQLAAAVATGTVRVRVASHAERRASIALATEAIDHVAEDERRRLRQAAGELETRRTKALEALEARAEVQRRECAAALLREVFGSEPTSFATLVARWRSEPSRALTIALRERLDALNARALEELGGELGDHLLPTVFADTLAAKAPASINRIGTCDRFGANDKVVSAAATFRRAAAPVAMHSALEALESGLIGAARATARDEVDPVAAERHALRRAHATRADLVPALAAFDEARRAREIEAFSASYQPPPPQPPLRARLRDWVSGALGGEQH